ncbi:hypothetical protein [Christiangramia crocea]|uniref:Uncharacterized protein n=1 Tax=Christiangramia crocea TaxID=2904124 RepID=A0A9X2A5E6_9FLAO|nr:hypothetical protein [Gramella crocea]MCG9971160.1 hypothetical protein [Gramella crocea]
MIKNLRHNGEMKHYQETIDKIFGKNFKHRTLRTLFDCNSEEWNETTISEKLKILRTIKKSKEFSLEELILEYKIYYSVELKNKDHVLNSLEKSLEILLENAI